MTNPNDNLERIRQVEERYRAKPLLWRLRNWVACPNPLETAQEAAAEIASLRAMVRVKDKDWQQLRHGRQHEPPDTGTARLHQCWCGEYHIGGISNE